MREFRQIPGTIRLPSCRVNHMEIYARLFRENIKDRHAVWRWNIGDDGKSNRRGSLRRSSRDTLWTGSGHLLQLTFV